MGKKLSASSKKWLARHFNDPFVKEAQKRNLRSRAYFKLEELQKSDRILHKNILIVELGSAPGSWSEYAITKIGNKGRIIACDLLEMKPLAGVEFIQGDFTEDETLEKMLELIGEDKVDLVMSDMAPNFSGIVAVDIAKSLYLTELALDMCFKVLKPKGSFVVKLFQGSGSDEFLKQVKQAFGKVKIRKPQSSREKSREVYVVATDFKLNND